MQNIIPSFPRYGLWNSRQTSCVALVTKRTILSFSLLPKIKDSSNYLSGSSSSCYIWNAFFFFKKWANPGLFFVYFRSFSNKHNTILQQINVKKCSSSIQRKDSNPQPLERESPPITTRPGLPHFDEKNPYPILPLAALFLFPFWFPNKRKRKTNRLLYLPSRHRGKFVKGTPLVVFHKDCL